MKSYKERCADAVTTVKGDKWIHLKNGKIVEVAGRLGIYGIYLLHPSGRQSVKLDHYLASDYELLSLPKMEASK